jgi:hypothetical protein
MEKPLAILLMLSIAIVLTLAIHVDIAKPEVSARDFSLALQPPDVIWSKTYGYANNDAAYSVIQTSDGGYLMAGFTWYTGENTWLVKTDADGNIEWNQTYGSSRAYDVIETDDGGYALVTGDVLIKTDANGIEQWYGTYGFDWLQSLVQTNDGGYALGGTLQENFYLVKTNATGSVEWTATFDRTSTDRAHCVLQTKDEGYLIAGESGLFDADVWLVKTDSYGNEEWNKTYGGTGYDRANSVVQTKDGGYAIGGYTESWYTDDFYLIKTDSHGNVEWSQMYGSPSFVEWADSVIQTTDGGYLLAGNEGGWSTLFLVRVNATGHLMWSKSIGGAGDDAATSAQQATDGGYIVSGYTSSLGAGQKDFWLLKVAAEDIHDLAVTRAKPRKTIVGQGYPLRINVTVENQGNFAENFNLFVCANWTDINQSEIILPARSPTTAVFICNTTGFSRGNYTVSAYTPLLIDEFDTTDNNYTDSWVYISIAGDVTSTVAGMPDGRVDMRDIGAICSKFMTTSMGLNWDPDMDINDDGTVNMRDIGIACDNFMKT